MSNLFGDLRRSPLYSPDFEHDGCGVGFVANLFGQPSHLILQKALQAVGNLTHRGAVDADARTGDGAGVLTQLPYRLFLKVLREWGDHSTDPRDLAVGMIFLPRQDEVLRKRCQALIEGTLERRGVRCLGWRRVPVDPQVLGEKAAVTQPDVQQLFMSRPPGLDGHAPTGPDPYERTLYLVRREIERRLWEEGIEGCYIPSFSHRTIVYKGLLAAPHLPRFYLDLQDQDFETALAVFHQRYSTNTMPTWFLAQAFRMIAHNGEINTIRSNRNWMQAREALLQASVWGGEAEWLKPVITPEGSDSASLDNVLEALVMSGYDILHAMMVLIPEAWENMPHMVPEWRAFYEYHACLSEAWDGPAAVAFSDGRLVGATLDRNGLRPARYQITEDGVLLMASEVGVVGAEAAGVVQKGRLGPGQMIAVDTAAGRLLRNGEIKDEICRRHPYADWVKRRLYRLDLTGAATLSSASPLLFDEPARLRQQQAFGYTAEDVEMILQPMAVEGKEPVGSMGDDTPLAVLSRKPRLLYSYFKELFAQVTNPPIDPLREQLVMSLNMYLGHRGSLFAPPELQVGLLHLPGPILLDHELEAVRELSDPGLRAVTLPATFPAGEGVEAMEEQLHELCEAASRAIADGNTLVILSDRGIDGERAPIPMLLAVAAVHHHLIRTGQRMQASLLAETGEAREVHHFALLIGYGASAVNPYLALEVIAALVAEGRGEAIKGLRVEEAVSHYRRSVQEGLLKIISKMGISTLNSYHGAQIFEVIGLRQSVVKRYFPGTPSRIGGIGLREVAGDVLHWHRQAFAQGRLSSLPPGGYYRASRDGEEHAFSPSVIKALHRFARGENLADYRRYAELVNGREPVVLRDLLTFKPGKPISLEEVEPASAIVRRISTQAMSLGALGPEAHCTLAIAMNRLGARSNTGEGGEDPAWFHPLPNGDSANSRIKQVASARFGVTPEYLVRAEQLEIKMAQGSKPGEGGQLPGHKVAPHIARIRHAVPGVPLISPPPHHDIYSIEDLSQLIYDLKQVNPRATVGVKLVAEAGVGTIAAGVAKGYADVILISGGDGGTGASPLSSIKNAGSPWELGLSETQQVLVLNDLRGRVTLRTDGGLKTGRDVVIAAMLGADEFGFGTAALVSIGCVMARQCHLNTCPVGIATQREELRAKFRGTPEMVMHFFTHVAEEVRAILADLGFRSLAEVIGRSDLLQQLPCPDHAKANSVDLGAILAQVDPGATRPRRHLGLRNDRSDIPPLNDSLLHDAQPALQGRGPVRLSYPIRNTDRTIGARLAGEIAYRFGDAGLPEGAIECHFQGSAGQSFGAFCIQGMRLILTGEANDYVGKGMGGGELVVRPPAEARFAAHENTIMGNTVLYGATGGSLFACGRAGERFAVRNSGALAVVEGIGDHGCEYMTGGLVVVLGETGRNFGAGMSQGVAYVLDEEGVFPHHYNPELVGVERLSAPDDIDTLRWTIVRHQALTGSVRAASILADWEAFLPLFWKVVPYPAREKEKAKPQPVKRERGRTPPVSLSASRT